MQTPTFYLGLYLSISLHVYTSDVGEEHDPSLIVSTNTSSKIMAAKATELTIADRPQQNSPLLRLPVELRTMIYDLALQDILDDLAKTRNIRKSKSADGTLPTLPLLGALEIPHTCHELRCEGIDAMRSLAEAKTQKRFQAIVTFLLPSSVDEIGREGVKILGERNDAYSEGRNLSDNIQKIAHNHLLSRLSRFGEDLLWSQMRREEKCRELTTWYYSLSLDDMQSLYPSIGRCEDIEDALVDIVDSTVGTREGKQ